MKKLFAVFFFCLSAHGSFLFEPYGGLTVSGELEEGSSKSDFSGSSFGAKLGAQYTYVFGGFDYRLGRFTVDGGTLNEETLNNEQYFAFVGYEFPMFFRVWGGLALGGVAKTDSLDYSEGEGTLLGFGYKGLPLVSLNLEYVTWGYNDVDPGGETDLEGSHLLFSLSLPINF